MALQSIFEWFFSNIAWTVLAVCFTILIACFQSIKIAKHLLRNNRYGKGRGWGEHRADRFIDIYFSNRYAPIIYGVLNNSIEATKDHWIDIRIVDNDLVELGLIARDERSQLLPIVTWRNRLIVFLIKKYLMLFIGDSKNYYKDLLDHSKQGDHH